jgi:hypothetical protein
MVTESRLAINRHTIAALHDQRTSAISPISNAIIPTVIISYFRTVG